MSDMISIGQPSERLLAGFTDVASALRHVNFIQEHAKKGIKTKIYVNFGEGGGLYSPGRDEDLKRNALKLDLYYKNRISIYWDPTIKEETWVVDELFHRGGEVAPSKKDFVPFRRHGFFHVRQGTVSMTQKLGTSPPDLDLMVRLKTDTRKSGLPIFLTSQILEAEIREGDQLRLGYVTNYSGEGVRTFFAPSQLFFEGLALDVIEKSKSGASACKTVREAADRLLSSLSDGRVVFSSDRDKKNNEFTRVRKIVKSLRDEGYFVEGSDEAYIRKKISDSDDSARG